MNALDYLPVLIQIILALALGVGILAASRLLGQRALGNRFKDSAYECGLPAATPDTDRYPMRFYRVALLFILFDIEVVFLLPWALVYRQFLARHISIVLPGLVLLTFVGIGWLYESRKGALKWED